MNKMAAVVNILLHTVVMAGATSAVMTSCGKTKHLAMHLASGKTLDKIMLVRFLPLAQGMRTNHGQASLCRATPSHRRTEYMWCVIQAVISCNAVGSQL